MDNKHFREIIIKSTGATDLYEIGKIQSLWSGYGSIIRYGLKGSKLKSVVVKYVQLTNQEHPRGWNTDRSHNRKLRSYEVETAWYRDWSSRCDESCYVPHCYALEAKDGEVLMVLEDLDSSGYGKRLSSVSWNEIALGLSWLANFHAKYMQERPTGLWKVGTYWHLATRPDELKVLDDKALKKAAHEVDKILNQSKYKTFVHGDAKLANFCFSHDKKRISAVDFQYVGGGCGMKDIAYFIGSCLYENECEAMEVKVLDYYFAELKSAVLRNEKNIDVGELEEEWRMLFPVAWTDFHRFIKGWSPGHWKINSYSERIAKEIIRSL